MPAAVDSNAFSGNEIGFNQEPHCLCDFFRAAPSAERRRFHYLVSIFGSVFFDDTFGSSLSLTMPSTLAPIRLDAGRNVCSSRSGHPSCDGGIHCPRAFRRLVADSPYLEGYCRWDSRFGRLTPPNNHTRDFMSHSLVEPVGRNNAAALLKRFAEARQTLQRLQPWR